VPLPSGRGLHEEAGRLTKPPRFLFAWPPDETRRERRGAGRKVSLGLPCPRLGSFGLGAMRPGIPRVAGSARAWEQQRQGRPTGSEQEPTPATRGPEQGNSGGQGDPSASPAPAVFRFGDVSVTGLASPETAGTRNRIGRSRLTGR
jgi:hypothetical protein